MEASSSASEYSSSDEDAKAVVRKKKEQSIIENEEFFKVGKVSTLFSHIMTHLKVFNHIFVQRLLHMLPFGF